MRFVYGAPPEQLARDLGISLSSLMALVSSVLHRLHESKYAGALRQELANPSYSADVWAGASEVPVHKCEHAGCTSPPFPQKLRGRPRRFCSSACRQAAYRERLCQPAGGQRQRTAIGTQPSGPRLSRLTDYSGVLPDFPQPEPPTPRPWGEFYKTSAPQALERWNAPTAAEPAVAGGKRHSIRTFASGTVSDLLALVLPIDGQHRVGLERWQHGVGLFGIGWRLAGDAQLLPLPLPRPVFLPPTPTTPLAVLVPEFRFESLARVACPGTVCVFLAPSGPGRRESSRGSFATSATSLMPAPPFPGGAGAAGRAPMNGPEVRLKRERRHARASSWRRASSTVGPAYVRRRPSRRRAA